MPLDLTAEQVEKEIRIIDGALELLEANRESNIRKIQSEGKYLPEVYTQLEMIYLSGIERLRQERLGYEFFL